MLLHPGLGHCQKICPVPSLDKLDEHGAFWELYLLKTRSLVVLPEYEIGGNSIGFQEILRNRLASLIEVKLKNDV